MIIIGIVIVGVPNMIHWNLIHWFVDSSLIPHCQVCNVWVYHTKTEKPAKKLVLFIQAGKIFVDISEKTFISDLPVERAELVSEKSSLSLIA